MPRSHGADSAGGEEVCMWCSLVDWEVSALLSVQIGGAGLEFVVAGTAGS